MVSLVQRARPKVDRKRKPRPGQMKASGPQRKRARHVSIEIECISSVETSGPTPSARPEPLTNLPVELLMEIAKYLRPVELLLLSRTNKSLRGVLMSRRASPIWSSAQLNVLGLPPCPSSLREPQYASLLFLKECSTCGRTTSYDIDFHLLVRLCVVCRRHQAVDASRLAINSLVFTSTSLMQRKRVRRWCLIDDATATEEKFNELYAQPEARALWIASRQEEIHQRYKVALALSEWSEEQDRIRKADLDNIKDKRQKEIESRLLDLGWERQDFGSGLSKHEWLSLTYNTKPLNDRAWSQLLPDLLRLLKQNRTERLQVEKQIRRNQRDATIKTWFRDTREETSLFAKAIPQEGSSGPVHEGNFRWSLAKADGMVLLQALPSVDNTNQLSCFKRLVEPDISAEELKVQLNEQHGALTDSIAEWQNELESALLEVLPENTLVPRYSETPGFSLICTGRYMRPFSELPVNLRKLLRADSTFTFRSGGISFYPDDCTEWTATKSPVKHHEKASRVAKGLLDSLGRPDASYLELKALGDAFQCGACNGWPMYMTWRSLILHYLEEEVRWPRNSAYYRAHQNSNIKLVFTHDVDRTNSTKPLAHIVASSDKKGSAPSNYPVSRCMICTQVRLVQYLHSDYIVDHVRSVHLVDEPKEGTHYQPKEWAN